VYALAKMYGVALPLHPEYRTMPMLWYVPPLSPIADALRDTGNDGEDVDNLFGAIETLRIPVEVADLGVDLLTLVGHTMYASKGIAALYVRAVGGTVDPASA
jgi:nitrate reductase beta subunit